LLYGVRHDPGQRQRTETRPVESVGIDGGGKVKTNWFIGLEIFGWNMQVFGDDRDVGVAMGTCGYDFVTGPYNSEEEARKELALYAEKIRAAVSI
jgi:hypothetical protein